MQLSYYRNQQNYQMILYIHYLLPLNQINIAIKHKNNDSEYYYLKAKILAKKDALTEAYDILQLSLKYSFFNNSRAHYLSFIINKILYSYDRNYCFKFFIQRMWHLCNFILQFPFDFEAISEVK